MIISGGVGDMGLIPYGEKGRPIGENHGFARWSDEIVEKVRDMHEHQKVRASEIRKLYNIPKSTLSYILNYKSRAVTPVSWKPKKEKRSNDEI